MPPTVNDRLFDIRISIERIEGATKNMTFESFERDIVIRAAIERFLDIICEASRHLPPSFVAEAPHVGWRRMIDFGNVLRHAYYTTKVEFVWSVITEDLPALKPFLAGRSL